MQNTLWMALYNEFNSMLVYKSVFLVIFEGVKADTCV